MIVGINVQNTSNQNLVVNSIAANVYTQLNGASSLIGNISNFIPTAIEPNSQKILLVKLTLSPISAINTLFDLIVRGNKPEISVQGYANVDRYQLPIDLKY